MTSPSGPQADGNFKAAGAAALLRRIQEAVRTLGQAILESSGPDAVGLRRRLGRGPAQRKAAAHELLQLVLQSAARCIMLSPQPLQPGDVEDLGAAYESLLDLSVGLDASGGHITVSRDGHGRRKSLGTYYTPGVLVEKMLDWALPPLLDDAAGQSDPQAAILRLKICDPACGAGRFLLATARRMAQRLAQVRCGENPPSAKDLRQAMADVLGQCIYGVDLDPTAVELARLTLWLESRGSATAAALQRNIRCGNALLGATPAVLRKGKLDGGVRAADRWCASFFGKRGGRGGNRAAQRRDAHRFFHWHLAFPDVFHVSRADQAAASSPAGWFGGFDLVIGNPPFRNIIEHRDDEAVRTLARVHHPRVGGTADWAYLFLSLGELLVHPRGRVALVQPRAVFSARAMSGWRASLSPGRAVRRLYAPDRPDFFAGADIYIGVVELGPDGACLVSRDNDPGAARWSVGCIEHENWWRETQRIASGQSVGHVADHVALGTIFEVCASMTAGDAYDLRPLVIDQRRGTQPRLVTTGLIDPDCCLWGRSTCRYLGRDYRWPRVGLRGIPTASLRRRLAASRRPKILVAGLSRRIECFLDASGQYVGAVSTYTITHPRDDVAALRRLRDALLSDSASQRFRNELGGGALGGGNTTMSRGFLRQFPLEAELAGRLR